MVQIVHYLFVLFLKHLQYITEFKILIIEYRNQT